MADDAPTAPDIHLKRCNRCGLSMMESSGPQEKDGHVYCCSGCAQGGDCVCD